MAFRALLKKFHATTRSAVAFKSLNSFFIRLESSNAVSYTNRTHTCGALRANDVGKQVKLCGWVRNVRMDKFIILRDWQGVIQLLIPEDKAELVELVKDLNVESVIKVCGTVKPRDEGQANLKMETGEIEVHVDELTVLNTAIPNLPVDLLNPEKATPKETLRMQYRYLDIRTNQMQRNLRLRSKFIMKMREFLINSHDFVDVETPTLFRKTPGGAKEFVVPCQQEGKFYSLPQSPQQFKQLLMVGGIDRYFQIARCYRDEGAKPDRQPEFTQLDLEMSFVTRDRVMSLIEELLKHSWPEDVTPISTPFPHMTYEQAMRLYGTDKPDTRFDMQLIDLTDIQTEIGVKPEDLRDSVVAMKIPMGQNYFSNKQVEVIWKGVVEQMSTHVQNPPGLMTLKVRDKLSWRYPDSEPDLLEARSHQREDNFPLLSRLQPGQRDLVFICVKNSANTNMYSSHEYLGRLRLKCADHIEKVKGVPLRDKNQFNFLWVEDFPLFLPKEDGTEGLESAHHPFTDVHPEDKHMFYSDPSKVRGQHYDLVVNGNEVGGGSIRIHNNRDQEYVIQDVLKEDSSQLKHLLEAFSMGCPPHGGIALGLDRLLSVICGSPTIRDVIAFPKGAAGGDPMSGAPTEVPQADLDRYHIQVKPSK